MSGFGVTTAMCLDREPGSWIESLCRYEFLQNAIVAGLLVSVICAMLGVYLVLRNMSLLGDGIAHISFGGAAVGLAAGVLPFGTALVAAISGAILIHLLREHGYLKGDAAIGMLFTAGLATGILVVSSGHGLGNVHGYLFGNLLAISTADVWGIVGVGIALLVLLVLFHREFFYMTFSEEASRVSGLPVRALNLLFVSLTAAAIVSAARVTGVLLVSALIIVPASTALQFRQNFSTTVVVSVLLGASSVFLGLAISIWVGTGPGATIALTNIGLFAIVALARAAMGLRTRARRVRAPLP